MPITALIAVMIVSGGFGGLTAYITSAAKSESVIQTIEWPKLIALGVIVSFTVPLFLSLAQSGLIDNIINPPDPAKSVYKDVLVLAGFCIIAAFSARPFLERLSERVLADLQDTKSKIRRAR